MTRGHKVALPSSVFYVRSIAIIVCAYWALNTIEKIFADRYTSTDLYTTVIRMVK